MTRRGFMKVAAMGTGSVAAGGGMASDGGSRSDAQSVTGAETGDRFVRVGESDGKWWFLQEDGLPAVSSLYFRRGWRMGLAKAPFRSGCCELCCIVD